MANLKRNMIELVMNPQEAAEGGEIEFKKYWTPNFLPLEVSYEAVDLWIELEEMGDNIKKEIEWREKAHPFIADKLYGGQFTADELKNGLHGPESGDELTAQILFAARGFQNKDIKKLQGKNR